MAWVAVDENKSEWIFEEEPTQENGIWMKESWENECVRLPKGSIKKLIGRELTWEDKPVELKEQK